MQDDQKLIVILFVNVSEKPVDNQTGAIIAYETRPKSRNWVS